MSNVSHLSPVSSFCSFAFFFRQHLPLFCVPLLSAWLFFSIALHTCVVYACVRRFIVSLMCVFVCLIAALVRLLCVCMLVGVYVQRMARHYAYHVDGFKGNPIEKIRAEFDKWSDYEIHQVNRMGVIVFIVIVKR